MSTTGTPARRPWRARGRRLAEALATPRTPEDYLALVNPLRSREQLRGRVVDLVDETADARTFVIEPGRGWRGHRPGQYLRIGVDVDGVRLWRAYSVTSGPRDDGRITITVKSLSGGLVSSHLHESLRAGQIVHLEQASGEFVWTGGVEPTLYVTGGSGITPVMGMLRHRLAVEDARSDGGRVHDIVVVHSAAHPEDVIFADELRELHEAGRIRLVERHTDRLGMLDTADLGRLVPDWAQRETWACGPAGMLEMLEAHWAGHGHAHRLHTERFRASLAQPGEGGTVYFTGLDREVDCDGARPILDHGEEAGVLMPSGCRMGICYGCVLPLREGAVRDLRTGELTTAVPGDGVLVQTCISAAAGRCDLDL